MYVYVYISIYFFGFSWVKTLAMRIGLRSVVPTRSSRGIVVRHSLRKLCRYHGHSRQKTVPSIHVKYVVQTVSFRLWYDPIPGISYLDLHNVGTLFYPDLPFIYLFIYFSEFRKMYWQHFESLCHKWLKELCQNISTFKSTLFGLFKKEIKNNQCNMAYVYSYHDVKLYYYMYAKFIQFRNHEFGVCYLQIK